jgi:hypothetical protein
MAKKQTLFVWDKPLPAASSGHQEKEFCGGIDSGLALVFGVAFR